MSKTKKIHKLEAILQKREEVLGGREIEFSWSGKHYTFPHPAFASDDWAETLTAAGTARENGVAVLGEEQYEKFRADGGQASYLMALVQEVTEDAQGTTPDGTPTPSSTS